MASIVVSGDTSGAVTLSAPSVAGTTTVTLPSSTGTMAILQTPSFATTIGVGGATASASGSGISFPATQSASSDANTLDDYEEGTWTPTIGGNATYNVQEGQYVKVGQLVYIFFDIAINVLGTGSTSTISGVPFTAANIPNVAAAYTLSFSYYANIATSVTWLSGYVPENATTISCSGNQTSASTIQVNGFAVFANGARISGSGVYRASA